MSMDNTALVLLVLLGLFLMGMAWTITQLAEVNKTMAKDRVQSEARLQTGFRLLKRWGSPNTPAMERMQRYVYDKDSTREANYERLLVGLDGIGVGTARVIRQNTDRLNASMQNIAALVANEEMMAQGCVLIAKQADEAAEANEQAATQQGAAAAQMATSASRLNQLGGRYRQFAKAFRRRFNL